MTRQHIVFLTGAGISAESGLSTFRGKDGLWTKEEFQYYASTDCLYNEPEKCLNFYNMRRKKLSEVEPNEAHRLIAELEKEHEVTVITQNVDNLHERAGSTKVIHLHGEMTKVCSSDNRHDERYIKEYPLTTPLKVGDDAADGSQLRPYIVMFGEYVKGMDVAEEIGTWKVDAVPAYNTSADKQKFHPKGRDNGYVLTIEGLRIYIAGDTEPIPEMQNIKDIDVAFLPCNLPFTMPPEQLAEVAKTIRPKFYSLITMAKPTSCKLLNFLKEVA